MRDWELYKKDFQCEINKEKFQLGLNVYLSVNLAWEKEQLGTAKSIISMSFENQKRSNDILVYYLYLSDFLEFVNFQKNIPLEHIELFERCETGKFEKRGRAVIFQADCSDYVPSALRSITFSDIASDCFPILFSQIAEKRLSNNNNPFFYPESRREDRTVDASKWLNTAICFEGEFNTSFPEYRATHDSLFHDAKALLLDAINSAVQKSGKSINNKQNNALKSFKSLIEHADSTIKQKFEVCEANYLHLNAYDKKARGTETYYVSSKGKVYAKRVNEKLATVFTKRGAKKINNLYFLNQTKPPAILIESFFCDNISDCELGKDKEKIGKLIAEGIHGKSIE